MKSAYYESVGVSAALTALLAFLVLSAPPESRGEQSVERYAQPQPGYAPSDEDAGSQP